MTTKYIWKRIDPDFRGTMEPHIKRWAWLLPPWLGALRILPLDDSEGDDGHTLADMDISQYRYREMILRLSSRLLLESEDDQSRAVLHEYVHVVLSPLTTITEKLSLDSPVPELLAEAEEQIVEDVVRRIWENFD